MRDELERRSLRITLVLVLFVLGSGAALPALGANCGDGVAACSCGDTVVTNTKLSASDPVLRTPCPCDGLLVASGVRLVVAGTIRSQENLCSGIKVVPNATDVVVTTGRIIGFASGVEAIDVTGVQISRLQIAHSRIACIDVQGNDTVIEQNATEGCGSSGLGGIVVFGDGNQVNLNRTENGRQGILIGPLLNPRDCEKLCRRHLPDLDAFFACVGRCQALDRFHRPIVNVRNLSFWNEDNGFVIFGNLSLVERNQSKYNGGAGYLIFGTDHQVNLNIAEGNLLDGLEVFASDSTFERNRSNYNTGFGIVDSTTGAGTANTYLNNRCTGNDEGKSSPPGLCQ